MSMSMSLSMSMSISYNVWNKELVETKLMVSFFFFLLLFVVVVAVCLVAHLLSLTSRAIIIVEINDVRWSALEIIVVELLGIV